MDTRETIRTVLDRVAKLAVRASALGDDSDLHAAGLTSFGTVELMLALEEAFGVEFPEDLITRARFSSVAAVAETVRLATAR